MGSQLGSQALASFAISVELMPTVYRMASRGAGVCYGVDCFLDSFLALAAGIGAPGGLVGRRLEPRIAAPALAAFQQHDLLADAGEIGQ